MLFFIALGGAAGALARYGLGGWMHARLGAAFPWGTFAVNAIGCLLVGFFLRTSESVVITPELRAGIAIGLLGAFTTFSTFSWEALALMRDGEWGRAGAYIGGSVLLGLAAAAAGIATAATLYGRAAR